jgi:hypothetical protein
MTFKSQVTRICDNTITSTVSLVAALVYDAQAQYKIISAALDNSKQAGNKN